MLAYLNRGGSIERLAEQASQVRLLGDVGVDQGYATPDLNGDAIPEIAIWLVDFTHNRRPGKVYVAMCEGSRYQLAYSVGADSEYPTARILATLDATGDGLVDLIIEQQGCGAHICFEWLKVVAWDETRLKMNDFDTACQAARDFAAAHTVEVIESLFYGYSNPSYTPAGLCPIGP